MVDVVVRDHCGQLCADALGLVEESPVSVDRFHRVGEEHDRQDCDGEGNSYLGEACPESSSEDQESGDDAGDHQRNRDPVEPAQELFDQCGDPLERQGDEVDPVERQDEVEQPQPPGHDEEVHHPEGVSDGAEDRLINGSPSSAIQRQHRVVADSETSAIGRAPARWQERGVPCGCGSERGIAEVDGVHLVHEDDRRDSYPPVPAHHVPDRQAAARKCVPGAFVETDDEGHAAFFPNRGVERIAARRSGFSGSVLAILPISPTRSDISASP